MVADIINKITMKRNIWVGVLLISLLVLELVKLGLMIYLIWLNPHIIPKQPEQISAISTKQIVTETDSADRPFRLQDNGYSGWQMGCNYTASSTPDNQEYFDCANGLVYKKIGTSRSVNYFNPNDREKNKKYCADGKVATFSYPDPISGLGGDEFADCINW